MSVSPHLPISLYIHIPWCVKKCPYCDFNSHNKPANLPFDEYFAALLQDFLHDKELLAEREIQTIFIGGGTPSLAAPEHYARLLGQLQEHCTFAAEIEITMELNPGTLEYHAIEQYFAAGINRISIGAQSFNNQSLKDLGRIHSRDETIQVIQSLELHNFNIDLMHSLPGQSLSNALDDLAVALAYKPPHLSWYQLTIEENTFFAKHTPILPSEKIGFEIYMQGLELLAENGYQRYEVSAFASKPKFRCRHNLNYWNYGDYLGIGCGAHSKITRDDWQVIRNVKVKHPQKYLAASPREYTHKHSLIASKDLPFEFFMNAARLIPGFDLNLFTARTNQDLTTIMPQLALAQEKQLITLDKNQLELTEYGKLFINELVEIFLC